VSKAFFDENRNEKVSERVNKGKRAKSIRPHLIKNNGDPRRTRTFDPMVKSHLLYRLSYRTTSAVYAQVKEPFGLAKSFHYAK
jgi:hypothetical protein